MNTRNFFTELKRRNLSEAALMSWLEEQNKGRQIGWKCNPGSGGFPAAGATASRPSLTLARRLVRQ